MPPPAPRCAYTGTPAAPTASTSRYIVPGDTPSSGASSPADIEPLAWSRRSTATRRSARTAPDDTQGTGQRVSGLRAYLAYMSVIWPGLESEVERRRELLLAAARPRVAPSGRHRH